jgi:xylulokinase
MHSSVFLDRGGAVVRPALLWCDGRTTAECAEITARAGGEARLRDLVRNPALEGFTLPKVLWLRRHEPDAYARVATVLLAKDYVRYRLTGRARHRAQRRVGHADVRPGGRALERRAARGGRRVARAPPRRGRVGRGARRGHGRGRRGHGAGDRHAGGGRRRGQRVRRGRRRRGRPGEAVASWGTSGTVLAPTAEPRVDPGLRAHTFCHAAPGVWYVMGVVLSAGGAWAWYRDRLAQGPDGGPDDAGPDDARLDAEAAAVAPGADGVTFLPYLQGERTPHRDASLRGALLGLSLAHTRAHVTRAVAEGVAFAMRDALEVLRALGLGHGELLLTGGGARSAFLRRLQADVYGAPVRAAARDDAPAYGAALLAAVGAGVYPDLVAAARATTARGPAESPDPAARDAYEAAYARFRALAGAARPAAGAESGRTTKRGGSPRSGS